MTSIALLSVFLSVPTWAADNVAPDESAPTSTNDVHDNKSGPIPSERVDKGTAEPMRQTETDKKAPGTRTSKTNLKQKKHQGSKTGVGGGAGTSNSNAETNTTKE